MTLKLARKWYRQLTSSIGKYAVLPLLLSGVTLHCSFGMAQPTQNRNLTLSEFYPFGPTILEPARPALLATDGHLVYSIAQRNESNFNSYLHAIRAKNCKTCATGCNTVELESLKNQIQTRNRSLLKQLHIRLDSMEAKYIQFEAKIVDLDQFQRRRSLVETIAEERFEKFGNAWLQTYQSCDNEKSEKNTHQTTGLFLAYYTALYRFLEILPPKLRSSF